MKQFTLFFLLATAVPAIAQRGREGPPGGFHRGGGFGNGAPNTLVTVVSPVPAATPVVGTPNNSPPASGSGGSGSGGSTSSGAIDVSLIPPYGVTPGVKLNDGTPRCAGDQGKPIDCDCPPDVNLLAGAIEAQVALGRSFPNGKFRSSIVSWVIN
jgi:hypothetical protein